MNNVTVVIPATASTKEYLDMCVKSLKNTTDWPIIVVSNGGPDWGFSGEVRKFHLQEQGQCKAVNYGARYVETEWMMVCNDDMYFPVNWTKWLRFDDLCFSPNMIEPVEIGSAPPFVKFDGGTDIQSFKSFEVDQFVNGKEAETTTSGFNLPFFIRKDVWDTIGGYDEAYDPWGSNSDTDLQTLIELAGIKPKRYRDVQIYHFGSKSGTFDPSRQSFWQKNFDYYTEKFGFNRDQLQSDTWMCERMIDYGTLKFQPKWRNKYVRP